MFKASSLVLCTTVFTAFVPFTSIFLIFSPSSFTCSSVASAFKKTCIPCEPSTSFTIWLMFSPSIRNIPNIMTNYEKQYQKEGRPIYYVDAKFDE